MVERYLRLARHLKVCQKAKADYLAGKITAELATAWKAMTPHERDVVTKERKESEMRE